MRDTLYMKKVMLLLVGLVIGVGVIESVLAATFTINLTLGARGQNVKTVQEFLITQGYLFGQATGYYGIQTKLAVQKFQKQNKISPTGVWSAQTRQLAEIKLNTAGLLTVSTSGTAFSTNPPTASSSPRTKNLQLALSVGYGGNIFSKENNIACYSFENCNVTINEGKTVTLEEITISGYSFKGWSEAGCGTSPTCTFKMTESMKVTAYFEVLKEKKPTGYIMADHPSSVCYIQLGKPDCDFRFTYKSNAEVNVKVNDDEYMIVRKGDDIYYTGDTLPEDISKAISEKVDGLVYFKLLPFNKYKIQLLDRYNKTAMDSINVEVKCASDLMWDGAKCWKNGANTLFVFKQSGIIFTSEPSGIICGAQPESCYSGFSYGQKVILKASTTPGYSFSGWTGGCSGNEPTCTLIMDKQKTVGAIK